MYNVLEGCEDISIYLGNTCNFECTYCDRDYIKNTIGGQIMSDVEEIITFLKSTITPESELRVISFHGGEPFVYVKFMDTVMDRISEEFDRDFKFFIQTNGSLIAKNEQFIKKWNDSLLVSISYDFMFQGINRTDFDINEAISVLHKHNVYHIQYQYVMPIDDPGVFSFKAMENIISVCRNTTVRHVNLIPLRHIRGKDKFRVIVDEIILPEFFGAFLNFIQMLYIQKIDVVIDGHNDKIDKDYFANHKQLVLSPDGYIYPEYDFLEYKVEATRIGRWRGKEIMVRRESDQEENLLHEKCLTCPSRSSCGLKYLYKLFERPPGDACEIFYAMLDAIIKHNMKLKEHKNLFEAIGM